ncbi:hypothetical protein P8C59_005752 [Phyllachora maydis]|uniref:Uncharacterized protein n=1 Tax=Phyllachora maydis TaxID=1825666 RepID=A0AAD9I6R4_9PEZI|nr:hypothetical protein P8C59_005752 [Phyllachora maydis]
MRRPSVDLAEPSRNLEESLGVPSPSIADPDVDLSVAPPASEIETLGLNTPIADAATAAAAVASPTSDPSCSDASAIYTPPPHIAARLIYRPTNQTRRKTSAASSRRNSISSSVHSLSSPAAVASQPPSEQSKHVAQHLRRASILEDRKARLADRAAHAEKVRLRAALARAAARITSGAVSEERAAAAAQARERNLAEIAAACAEEVKRAKAVAESMKEKRERAILKMRVQMEERHAEAERRREELRTKIAGPRGKSTAGAVGGGRYRGQGLLLMKSALFDVLPDVEEGKERENSPTPSGDSDEAAAIKVQWWWRGVLRRNVVTEFAELGLSIDGVSGTSFEDVTELLSQDQVLVKTARILYLCGLREGESGSVDEMAAVRSFLSAFMILGHPAQVLSNKEGKGEQEQDLVGKARDLLIFFENTLSRLNSLNNYTPPPTLLQAFPEAYAAFYNAFIAWKARDSNSLVELMVMQFVELDAILQTVKNSTDGSVDEVYQKSIQENQVLLLVRIKKLAGPIQGKKLVADAVRTARKARAKKPMGDTRPRVAEEAQSLTAAAGEPSTSGQRPLQPTGAATHKADDASLPVGVHIGGIKGLLPDNRILVHELAINREFRIEPDEYRQQQEHLLAPIFAEMRSTMQADNQEGHFLLLLEMAKYIRERLQRLVKPGTSMHTFIGSLLDADIARRQFLVGSFSYEKFFHTMGALLPKLCAPVRDADARALVDGALARGSYVDRLEALMGFLDVMLSDYANYLLQVAAPTLAESAAPYEAKCFAALLASGRLPPHLPAATAAWRAARRTVRAESARRDPEGGNHPRPPLRATPDRIYAQMLVDLFVPLGAPREGDKVPEMLRLDGGRAASVARATRRIVVAGAVLLQAKNLLKRDARVPWRGEALRIMAVLERADEGAAVEDGILAALESGRSMPAATKAHLHALVARFVGAAVAADRDEGGAELREPVLRLLLTRLRGHVLGRLTAASASEKVKAASLAGERLAGLGLGEFVERVGHLVEVLGRVGKVDRDAHGAWWDQLAEVVEREEEEGGAAGGDLGLAA